MPALPPVPGVLRITLVWSIGEDNTAITRLHYTYTGTAPTDATCNTLAASVFGSWGDLLSYCTPDRIITEVQIEDLTSATSGVGSHTGTAAGTLIGGAVPASVCALVNTPIARRYRGGKPRTYWPAGGQSEVLNSQQWTTAFVGNFQTALVNEQTILNAISAAGCSFSQWVSISYYEGFTAVTNPITGRTRDVPKVRTGAIPVDPILAFSMRQNFGTQRRRTLIRA